MEKLSVEEIKHIAHLARIEVSEDEIEKYRVSLAKLFNQIDEIHQIEGYNDDMMLAPWSDEARLRCDEVGEMLKEEEVLVNAPKKNGKFVEVPVMLNEQIL